MSATDNTEVGTVEESVIVPGSWQDTLSKSATLLDRSAKGKARATAMLWEGSQVAINEWLPESDTDVNGEEMQAEVTAILGKARKGDASKIKTVALAVRNNGLVLNLFPNLSKAYAEARRLTQTVQIHAAEDEAAEAAVAAISAPKSTQTAEGAAALLLSRGVDEAARILLEVLGSTNHAAHRSLLRALSLEAAGLIPKPEPKVKAEPKPKGAAKAVAPKDGAAKAKPVKKAVKPKPVQAPVEEAATEEPTAGDMFDEFDLTDETVKVAAPPVKKAVVRPKGRPVVKR
jgi:hypothetical protein